MITVEQIRAARALLDWSQDQLAQACGVSKPAINNLERRVAKPRFETLRQIKAAFEQKGIEFVEGGARFRGEKLDVQTMEGEGCVFRLLTDVLDTVPPGGEALVSGLNERYFVDTDENQLKDYIRKTHELNIQEKLLIREGDQMLYTKKEYYRWVPENVFSQVPYFVYGTKYAMVLWGPPQKVVLIDNASIAESFRKQFYVHWNAGKIPKT